MRRLATLVLLLACSSAALADEILLRNGHKITGIEREEKDRIVIETGYGTVAFPRDQVVSVTKGETALHAWPIRYAEIEKSKDAKDFTKLAAWATENGMPRYVNGLMKRALELDPDNAEARANLGYVRHQGRWLTVAELRKEQGLVRDAGRWVLPLEKELEERRRLEAESRRIDQETERKREERRRRRARETEQAQARIRAAEQAPLGFTGLNRGYELYDLILVDWLLAFRANPGVFPHSIPRPSPRPGKLPMIPLP